MSQLSCDSASVLAGLPRSVVMFSALVAGVLLRVSLLIVVVGVSIALTTLLVAADVAVRERRRLDARGTTPTIHIIRVQGNSSRLRRAGCP